MALNPADIATVSRLLDEALALEPAEREAWLAALPAEHQRHAQALRDMLAQEAQLDTDPRLGSMPKLATDDAVAHAGDRIGPYRLLHEIGRGGMGSVWLAERADGAYKRQVALKLPRLAWGAGLAERMAREREIGMLLEHPNIARLYDAGVDERGRPFLALEYVDGQPIDAWCEAQGLSVRERLRLFVQVIKAVAYAHGRLVVHRDLKPSNVLVTPDGQARLLDFGIAKLLLEAAPGESGLTQEQGRVLTPHYASPEQVAGEAITVQSDVYSLGVLLYELLTGKLPIAPKRGTLGAVEEAILQGDAPLASSRVKDRPTARSLRGEVDAILAKSMQREPGRRYATADALALDIERHLNGETVAARPDSLAYRVRKAMRRHWMGVSAVAAVLVAIVTGSGVAAVQAQRASKALERQQLITAFVSDVFRINAGTGKPRASTTQLTGDRLLAEGASLIVQRFPGEPSMQADLFGVVSGLFLEMAAAEQAMDYATRQLEALDLVRADDHAKANALNRLAQALILRGRIADAESRARRAAELVKGDDGLEIDVLATQGQALMRLGRYDICDAVLDRIARLSKRLGRETAGEAWSHGIRGSMLAGKNMYAESGQHYQRGIDMALRVEGPLSLTAVVMRELRSSQMMNHGEAAAARPVIDAAVDALRQRGGASAIRAEINASYAARWLYDAQQIPLAEALATIDHALEVVASHPAAPSSASARVRFEHAAVLSEAGRVAEGWAEMKDSAPIVLAAFDSPFRNFRHAAVLLGGALAAGDFEAARTWNAETIRLRKAMGEENHPFAVYDHIVTARIELQQGNHVKALQILDRAPRFEALAASALVATRTRDALTWERASVLVEQGDFESALKLVSGLDPGDGADNNRLLAMIDCARGQPEKGRLTLAALANNLAQRSDASSPFTAHLRSLEGLCAFATRDRTAARELAAQARAAFTAQPGVSPYFKAPLVKLERALGLKLPAI